MEKKLASCLGIPEGRGLTAIVGGGGKTSLMFALAREYARAGKAVVICTTTKIYIPNEPDVISAYSGQKLSGLIGGGKIVCLGKPGEDGKLRFPGGEAFIQACRLADRVIVEADGARHCPVKAPGEREPVLPDNADSVIAVAGLDALGQRICDVSFRPEKVAEVLGVSRQEVFTPKLLARLLVSPTGQRKNVPEAVHFAVVLNKADDAPLQKAGAETAEMIQSLCPDCTVLVTALEQNESIKALYK